MVGPRDACAEVVRDKDRGAAPEELERVDVGRRPVRQSMGGQGFPGVISKAAELVSLALAFVLVGRTEDQGAVRRRRAIAA